jgi:hypothetical protein
VGCSFSTYTCLVRAQQVSIRFLSTFCFCHLPPQSFARWPLSGDLFFFFPPEVCLVEKLV